jgi:CubicO group peptidase (beta-lactamase class C family)
VGFVLLGLLIEKVTGLSYRDYVRRHIFARANMAASGFFRMDQVAPNVAEGADPIYTPIADGGKQISGWVKNIYSLPPIGSPDGGAHVTAADLDAFLWALKDGKLLGPELTRAFLTPQLFHRNSRGWMVKYGYGLEFFLNAGGTVDFYQKDGLNAGVSGVIRCYPAHDLQVTMLSNMMEGAWAPLRKVHELLTAAGG